MVKNIIRQYVRKRTTKKDKEGIIEFIDIIEQLNKFSIIEFDWKDIVRSDFVRDYIMTKEMMKK